MKPRHNIRGSTSVEAVISISLISMMSLVLVAMLIGAMTAWCSGTGSETANSSVTIAIQKLANDIRDGKSASVSSNMLTVTFPKKVTHLVTGETIYDLSSTDPETHLFYLDDKGNLWRKVGANAAEVFARGIYVPDPTKTGDPAPPPFSAQNGEVNVMLKGMEQVGTKVSAHQVVTRITLRNFRGL